jgi:hypothetical protein
MSTDLCPSSPGFFFGLRSQLPACFTSYRIFHDRIFSILNSGTKEPLADNFPPPVGGKLLVLLQELPKNEFTKISV